MINISIISLTKWGLMVYSLYTMKSIGLDLELRQCDAKSELSVGQTCYVIEENNSVNYFKVIQVQWEGANYYPSTYRLDNGTIYRPEQLYVMYTRESLPQKV